MATSTRFIAPSMASDAVYRLTSLRICLGIDDVGLIQTSDTGQADWVSETRPGTANTYNAYRIYRFDDSLQSGGGSNPVFLKIEFGTGSTTSNYGLRFSISDSTNGAGTLNGTFVSSNFTIAMQRNSTTEMPCLFSGDGGRLQMGLFVSDSQTAFCTVFSLSRTVDASGVPTNAGCNMLHANETFKRQQFISNASGGGLNPSSIDVNYMTAVPVVTDVWSGTYGRNIAYYPIYPHRGYADNFDLGALCYFRHTLPHSQQVIELDFYGQTHRFITIANTSGSLALPNGNSAQMAMLMRYE